MLPLQNIIITMYPYPQYKFYYRYVGASIPLCHYGYKGATLSAHHAYITTLLHLSLMIDYAGGGQLDWTSWATL